MLNKHTTQAVLIINIHPQSPTIPSRFFQMVFFNWVGLLVAALCFRQGHFICIVHL